MTKPWDETLLQALNCIYGATERWAVLREHGATDGEVLQAVRYEFGIEGGFCGPDIGEGHYKGGAAPRFWHGSRYVFDGHDHKGRAAPATLSGDRLVSEVRRVLDIPYPRIDAHGQMTLWGLRNAALPPPR